MTQYIRITDAKAGPDGPLRFNPLPGRYLSEREFELLQAYVDDRIAPLARGLVAGIVSGLQVRSEGSGRNLLLTIQPGLAVGAGGRLLRLFYPLKQEWRELTELVQRQEDSALADGLYWLTLRAVVEPIDAETSQEPCTRSELDPTRQRRLETVILPGLQLISANPRLLAMPQNRAANRICVRFLNESPHDLTTGAVPVALVKVINASPEWLDPVAGRFSAEADAAYRTLLAHSVMVMEQWLAQGGKGDAGVSLATQLGIDYLPAAGPLPVVFLESPAAKHPKLAFQPADLQVEMIPVPASTVGSIIDCELARGVIDLVHGLGDRIRLLLAIPDLDYRPDLLDLPQRDTALEDELFHREEAATRAWKEWWLQWQLLFGGLSAPELKSAQASTLVDRPRAAAACRDDLVSQRRQRLGDDDLPLPEPYSSHLLSPHAVTNYTQVEGPLAPTANLFEQQDGLRSAIQALEADLDESYRLLNEVDDYLGLQRQQLDSLTVSFSALAGGVAGDGSGTNMMRWNGSVAFDPSVIDTTKG